MIFMSYLHVVCSQRVLVNVSNFSDGKRGRNQERRLLDIEGELWIEIIHIHV